MYALGEFDGKGRDTSKCTCGGSENKLFTKNYIAPAYIVMQGR